MEVQPSHIVSDEGVNMSSGVFPKNSSASCSSDLNSALNRINVNDAICVNNNGSSVAMPATTTGIGLVNQKQHQGTFNTAAALPAAAPKNFTSGVTFGTSAPPSHSIFRNMEHTSSTTSTCTTAGGQQGTTINSLQQNNLFTMCTTNSTSTPSGTTSSGSHVDTIKTSYLDSGLKNPDQEEEKEQEECSGSGINLACSETASNFEDEDDDMDTGSMYSFRSDMDQGSSCTINGSQCSDSTGLHPTSSSSSTMPRRTKNGILLRDRTNRLPVADRVRQKRSTMQDMARPLKHWLYKHRNNPYPSKADKQQLAIESHMSLTQVSNWFANARRRLKNTVRNPECSWETRIRQYNSHVQGNAELLSVSSDSSGESDTEACAMKQNPNNPASVSHVTNSETQSRVTSDHDVTGDVRAGLTSPVQHKFKQSILHRYLNDSFEHSLQFRSPFENRSRNPSGSVGSHDFEDCSMSMSSRSSPIHEHSFDDVPEDLEQLARQWEGQPKRAEDELYWKEISAALALTHLARSRYSKV